MANSDDTKAPRANREMDLDSLKGLAHPLRMQMFDILSTYGAFTASGLAERLGESSGATSYHLRQLERHGFVREVEGRGTGRERWWERVPGGVSLSNRALTETQAGRAASNLVMRQWQRTREQLITDFTEHGYEQLPAEWTEHAELTTVNLRLTPAELAEIVAAFEEFSRRVLDPYRGRDEPGSRPVQIHFNAFPVLDGQVSPAPEKPEKETRES